MNEKKAIRIYSGILNSIEKLVGNKTTYLEQLEGHGKKILGVNFAGVFPSDKIPRLNDLRKYAILNLDKSTQAGSHWVAVARDGDRTYIYDSFGRDHRAIIPVLSRSGNGRIINTDRDAEQHILETNCGARCLAWLVLIEKYGTDTAKLI